MSNRISFDSFNYGNRETMSLDQVPDMFIGVVDNFKVTTDESGNIVGIKLFVIYMDKLVIVSYPKIYLSAFSQAMKKLGYKYLDEIRGQSFKFIRTPLSQDYLARIAKKRGKFNYNVRHLPVSKATVPATPQQGEEEREEEREDEGEDEESVEERIKTRVGKR